VKLYKLETGSNYVWIILGLCRYLQKKSLEGTYFVLWNTISIKILYIQKISGYAPVVYMRALGQRWVSA